MFPDFNFEYNLLSGMEELAKRLIDYSFSQDDFDGDQFIRLKTISKKLDLIL